MGTEVLLPQSNTVTQEILHFCLWRSIFKCWAIQTQVLIKKNAYFFPAYLICHYFTEDQLIAQTPKNKFWILINP